MSRKRIFCIVGIIGISFFLFLLINTPEPIRIEGDGVFYYGWLRSVIFDQDIDLSNELDYYSSYDHYSKQFVDHELATLTGYTPNPYAFGAALLWLPFNGIAHCITIVTSIFGGNQLPNGYSLWYVYSVNFASWLFGMLSLWIIAKSLHYLFPKKIAIFTVLVLWLVTPWIYYQFFEPSMSHMASLMITSFFVYLILRSWYIGRSSAYIYGITIFFMIAVRWQNSIFLLSLFPLWKKFTDKTRRKVITSIMISVSLVVFLQIFSWKIIYGSFLLIPQGESFVLAGMHGLYTLISSDRGLFFWSPFLLFMVPGMWFLWQKERRIFYMTLTALIGQWVVNSTLSDLGGGDAFGARRFIGTLPFIAFAIAAFTEKCWHSRTILIVTAACFIIINLLLMIFFHYDLIPRHGTFNIFSLPLLR